MPTPAVPQSSTTLPVTTYDKAQRGLSLLKEAVLEEIAASPTALTHAEIVNRLELHSDFEGNGRNYLSWSVLGLLVNAGKVQYRGDRNDRVYFTREDQ